MVWAKGYGELIDLLAKHKNDLDGFKLDVYGNGEDAHEVQSTARKLNLNLKFMKGRDHADDSLHGYKVFINPSVSDVLCMATGPQLRALQCESLWFVQITHQMSSLCYSQTV